jgi:alkanesulfonate monooxygenase SsuD/methylene tetrahydromethanopterin reductase-like flavin-dependent oxidoreductase (luciferase family)
VAGLAVAAEDAGFDSVWVMDHFFQLPPLGGPEQPMLEAYTLLGALAARTRRVQLGTLVTGVTYRNPAILAKIVTTLDVISRACPGRYRPADRRS